MYIYKYEHKHKYNHKYKYKCTHKNQSVLGVVEGVSSSPAVLHHNPGALATTRLPLDTHQQLFLIVLAAAVLRWLCCAAAAAAAVLRCAVLR